MDRKRKRGNEDQHLQVPDDADLSLSLSPPSTSRLPPPAPPQQELIQPPQQQFHPGPQLHQPQQQIVFHPGPLPPPPHQPGPNVPRQAPVRRQRRNLRNADDGPQNIIPAPFPWATTNRATVHSLQYLLENDIRVISGEVRCKKCEEQTMLHLNLQQKFTEVAGYIVQHKSVMHDRAPKRWMAPDLPDCTSCGQANSLKPVFPPNKEDELNWLFLLLGQTLGLCTLEQLKYFCKHTSNHRTGAKNRVLYLAYLGLCKQLDPTGPFEYGN
ncbi:hypothetical protein GIB67_017494 [Kingdonia uniflora]|uniref:DUF7086 domain-containing protein n=1 Tax=Kingdonia uniflora TaxID=39325 RepID=A0A7J7M4D3_9MAGN|nr:hypothetical protein GIB67_017494 [Kingdonia uniflora]